MKRIALINDLSGFGKCSLTAAIPVISVMGIQACPLPTAVLTAQTEFGDYYSYDLTDKMDKFTEKWKSMDVSFDGIYSGYLADAGQMEKVEHFLEQFQEENTLYLADPVMGDRGMTYDMFNETFLQGMKELTKKADVITPNLMELCLLSEVSYEEMITHQQDEDYIRRIVNLCKVLLAKALKPQTVIVTGIVRTKDGEEYVGNLAVSGEECVHLENPYTGKGFSGTGDLFASVICGSLVKGLSVKEAVEKATYFLQEAIEEATEENIPMVHGVNFEKHLYKLL
ncbi:MAG: pyridoxamine kinase [Lachnospiraceae bacterium]|nr:pyridoxamine kinase [Lachnospiraceae bacterium]